MVSLIQLASRHSDAAVLITGAVVTVAMALLVALGAHRLWFAPRWDAIEEHNKLAEVVHASLLAFTVFILALVLSDVRSNLGRADDAISREGSVIARLDRDLATLSGAEAARARQSLRAYVGAVTVAEWRSLSQPQASLSPAAGQALATLLADIHATIAAHPHTQARLGGLADRLEEYRQSRLETATKSVPDIFWWLISVFLIGAMVLNGRHKMNLTALALIAIHMAAIGMVLAMIIIMDEPFHGRTSLSTTPLTRALEQTLLP
jgi:hypothetical protein